MPLYGREELEALVTELVQADRGPVVALDGSGGCGRSAALRLLAGQLRGAVPVATIDAARGAGRDAGRTEPPAQVSPLLLYAAAQLREPCAGFGRTPFHRLMLGHLALVQEPGPDDGIAVMRQVVRTYRQPGPRTRLVVDLVTGFGLAALSTWTGDAVLRFGGEQARRLVLYISGGRLRGGALRGAEQWYVERFPGLPDNVEGALDRMRQACGGGVEPGGADAVLVDAFLADLDAARYRSLGVPGTSAGVRVSRPGWRDRRAMLLLDDADRPPARRLLTLVCDARAARPGA